MTHGPRQLQLRVSSDPANLAPVRHELESFCAACGFEEPARGEIVLCVNEAMTNITRHAYDGATDQPIELSATFDRDLLRITLRDWGPGQAPRACEAKHDPLRPGGVGMLCLRQLMDRITFAPQPDGMVLVMERALEKKLK
jgi:serine/threonine-protein kinase RsbW